MKLCICEEPGTVCSALASESSTGCIAIVTCFAVGFRLTSVFSAVRFQVSGQAYHRGDVKHKLVFILYAVTPRIEHL